MAVADELARRVDADRLLRVTMSLLGRPSPSGSERAVSLRYADVLREAGLAVEVDGEFPDVRT